MNRLIAVAVAIATAASTRVAAEVVVEPPRSWLDQLLDGVHAKIDAAIIAKPPKLVPPKRTKLGTKLKKLGTLDIGGSLSALAAGDLDGNGEAELYAVTPNEVVAMGLDGKPRVLSRVAFVGDARLAAPRDVVASVVVEPGAVLAASSSWQKTVRVTWQKDALVAEAIDAGFPMCPNEYASLAPGRNFYGSVGNGHYGSRCSSGIVDADGYPLRTKATLSLANKLAISVARCAAVGLGCVDTSQQFEHTFVGTAFEIADLDGDGQPELASASAVAVGDPDVLRVVSLGGDEKKPKLKKGVSGGGIAGIVYADVDGNGSRELVIAVRVLGAPKVDLWRLQ